MVTYILLAIAIILGIIFRRNLSFFIIWSWIFGPACYIMSLVYFAVGHEDPFKIWTEHAHWCLNLKFVALEGSVPINKKDKIIVLANHRSTMDTFNSDP